MKIAIVYGWSDDNKGDSAIVNGTIRLLQKAFPEARFVLIPFERSLTSKDYRHLSNSFGARLQIVATAYPKLEASPDYLPSVINSWAAMLSSRPPQPDLAAIRSADLVVCKGGHVLHTDVHRSALGAFAAMLHYAYFPTIGFRYRKPVIFLGHSLGPFRGALDRYLATLTLRSGNMLFVREPISAEVALKVGVPSQRVKVIPDLAFAIEPQYSSKVRSLLEHHVLEGNRFLAVTVRNWHIGPSRQQNFLHEVARLVLDLMQRGLAEKVAIVAHTIGPTPIEDDRPPSRQLFSLLHSQVSSSRLALIEEDLSPEELAAFYGKARLLIGTRLHSVILASTAGAPSYPIAYAGPKAEGIMKMLGMDYPVQHIGTFSAEKAMKNITLEKIEQWKTQVRDRVEDLRRQLEDLVPFLRQLIKQTGSEA